MRYYLQNLYMGRIFVAAFADALCFAVAATVTWLVLQPAFSPGFYAAATAFGVVAAFTALYYCDAYAPIGLGSAPRTVAAVISAMGLAFVVALLAYFVVPVPPGSVEVMANVAALYFPLLLGGRAALRAIGRHPAFSERVLVLGTSELGAAIADAMEARPNLGLELVGFLSDDQALRDPGSYFADFPVLDRIHRLEKVLGDLGISRIVVASKDRTGFFPADALVQAKLRGVRIESGVAFYERLTGRIYLRELRPSYLIFSDGFRLGPLSSAVKRVLDVALSGLGLLLAAPVLGACALAIKLDSEGPVFYRQERLGRYNRPFRIWKLRSMKHRAEEQTGAVWAQREDTRITRVGRVLRRTRLDEMPQLLNVLWGDMSLVGPRPERPTFVDVLNERYPYFQFRSALKPGVTGWAQIRYGYVNDVDSVEEKLALDLYYMKCQSVTMDILILWQTVKTVLLFRGL